MCTKHPSETSISFRHYSRHPYGGGEICSQEQHNCTGSGSLHYPTEQHQTPPTPNFVQILNLTTLKKKKSGILLESSAHESRLKILLFPTLLLVKWKSGVMILQPAPIRGSGVSDSLFQSQVCDTPRYHKAPRQAGR